MKKGQIWVSNSNRKVGIKIEKYLKPEKRCLTDVKLEECLSYCSQNNECDGVEYNMYYKQNGSGNQNICCPKLNIGNLVERDEKNKYGNVYIKQM